MTILLSFPPIVDCFASLENTHTHTHTQNIKTLIRMFTLLFPIHWNKWYYIFFKVSGCKRFILATLKKTSWKLVNYVCLFNLNVAKINWLPLTFKKCSKFSDSFFSVYNEVNRDRSSKKCDSSIIFLKPYHKLVWETEQTLNMYKMCQQQKRQRFLA